MNLKYKDEKLYFAYNKAQHKVAEKAFDEAGICDLEPLLLSNKKPPWRVVSHREVKNLPPIK